MVITDNSKNERHLTENEIAHLIDGPSREEADSQLWLHLRSCEQCFSVYREAAVYRGIWDSERRAFGATEELVAFGKRIASAGGGGRDSRGHSRRATWFRRGFRYVSPVAAAVAAIFLIWSLMRGIQGPSSVPLAGGMYGPVKQAVEQATKRGAFVLPGGEDAISADNGFSYRSGYIPLDDELKTSLDEMFDAYREGDRSEDLIYWLIAGHVATGQMMTAREIVDHAHKLGIEEPRIVIVDAIITYVFGNHARSESMLRGLLKENPLDYIALINLAVILMQNDDRSEAADLLKKVIDSCDDSTFVARARTLLNQN